MPYEQFLPTEPHQMIPCTQLSILCSTPKNNKQFIRKTFSKLKEHVGMDLKKNTTTTRRDSKIFLGISYIPTCNHIHTTIPYTWHHHTDKHPQPSERKGVGHNQTLCIKKVKSDNEGYSTCVISNPTGGTVETKPARLTISMILHCCLIIK